MPEAAQVAEEPAGSTGGIISSTQQQSPEPSADTGTPAARESQNDANSEAHGDPTDGDSGGNPEPGKGKNWAARKIDQLTREREQERAEKLRLMGILEQGGQQRPAQQPAPQQQDPGPQRQQFNDYEAYLEARAVWAGEQRADARFQQRMAEMSQAQQHAARQRQAQEMAQSMATKLEEGRKAIPDFDAVMASDAADLPVGAAAPAIAASDNPAGVIHYLATHPEVARKVSTMSPIQAAKEIGKIEAGLEAPPQISSAPRPGKPVGARGGSPDGFRENMSVEEFVKWRQKSKG